MTGTCWQGQRHLPGIRRRDGSLWCARCGAQIQPANPAKAWGGRLPSYGLRPGSRLRIPPLARPQVLEGGI
jgi:hypothetical protein